jgi:diaminopimelate epimerase
VTTLRLSKHHGLGNDFLVVIDLADRHPLGPAAVAALCDRHRGVGADGVIRVLAGGDDADVTMVLRNADGSEAEMSGNGIRCLAQAVLDAGVVPGPEVVVATGAGPRRCSVSPDDAPGAVRVSVDMGVVSVAAGDEVVPVPGGERSWRGRWVAAGNPHLVLVAEDLAALDLGRLGPVLQASRPEGVNVEWIRAGPGENEVALRVWERGAGETLACGTGSTAAALAARSLGLVPGPAVVVHNPGGDLAVDCSGPTPRLCGPAQRVATMEVEVEP